MKGPGAPVRELAETLVRRETSPDAEEADQLAAAERLLGAIQDELIDLIGGTGFHALLDRSFHRAAAEHGFGGRPRPPHPPGNFLRDFRANMNSLPEKEIFGALVAVLAELLALLARLVGADITARLVHRAWPDAAPWLMAAHLEDGDG
jgi:hypothetical protein